MLAVTGVTASTGEPVPCLFESSLQLIPRNSTLSSSGTTDAPPRQQLGQRRLGLQSSSPRELWPRAVLGGTRTGDPGPERGETGRTEALTRDHASLLGLEWDKKHSTALLALFVIIFHSLCQLHQKEEP